MALLITGATGTVSRPVVQSLTDRANPFHVASHHVEAASAHSMYLDFFQLALPDIEKIVLSRSPEIADPTKVTFPFLQIAHAQGVNHIVFLSVMGGDRLPVIPHAKIEHEIRDVHMAYTFYTPFFCKICWRTILLNFDTRIYSLSRRATASRVLLIPAIVEEVDGLCLLNDRYLSNPDLLKRSWHDGMMGSCVCVVADRRCSLSPVPLRRVGCETENT